MSEKLSQMNTPVKKFAVEKFTGNPETVIGATRAMEPVNTFRKGFWPYWLFQSDGLLVTLDDRTCNKLFDRAKYIAKRITRYFDPAGLCHI